jgi:aldehyde:ferredoxin oxidoreductase
MYNVRCGVSRKDDTIPTRMLREKRGEGGSADNLPPFENILEEYYAYRGWDRSGVPGDAKLEELGLKQLVSAKA